MKSLTIRLANQRDNTPWDLLFDADPARAKVEAYLKKGELWIALQGSQIVGALVLMKTKLGVFEIMNVAVLGSLRGRGIGTALLKKARARAKVLGANKLTVGTGNNSFPQLKFYQRFGFRLVRIERNFFVKRYPKVYRRDGVPLIDLVRMEMRLS